jgi:hypothetical protein
VQYQPVFITKVSFHSTSAHRQPRSNFIKKFNKNEPNNEQPLESPISDHLTTSNYITNSFITKLGHSQISSNNGSHSTNTTYTPNLSVSDENKGDFTKVTKAYFIGKKIEGKKSQEKKGEKKKTVKERFRKMRISREKMGVWSARNYLRKKYTLHYSVGKGMGLGESGGVEGSLRESQWNSAAFAESIGVVDSRTDLVYE